MDKGRRIGQFGIECLERCGLEGHPGLDGEPLTFPPERFVLVSPIPREREDCKRRGRRPRRRRSFVLVLWKLSFFGTA